MPTPAPRLPVSDPPFGRAQLVGAARVDGDGPVHAAGKALLQQELGDVPVLPEGTRSGRGIDTEPRTPCCKGGPHSPCPAPWMSQVPKSPAGPSYSAWCPQGYQTPPQQYPQGCPDGLCAPTSPSKEPTTPSCPQTPAEAPGPCSHLQHLHQGMFKSVTAHWDPLPARAPLAGCRMVPRMFWLWQLSRTICTSLCSSRDSVKNLASAANGSGTSVASASRLNVGHCGRGGDSQGTPRLSCCIALTQPAICPSKHGQEQTGNGDQLPV